MDSWSVAATIFAAASLVAVMWQIARFEATQPAFGWEVGYGPVGDETEGVRIYRVHFRPIGPIVIHDIEGHHWGAANLPQVTERARMDCDSEPLVARVRWLVGKPGYVGFSWLSPSLLRQRPVRHAMRLDLQTGTWYLWRWHRIWRPKALPQGEWKAWQPRVRRRQFVPDLWGTPGST